MPTPAEKYANSMKTAYSAKPDDFVVDGQVTASVTSEGRCRVVAREMSADQVRSLRDWIKEKFIAGGAL